MKKLILASLLLTSSFCFAAEKVVLITDNNLAPVNELLEKGWSVKHQSAVVSVAAAQHYDRDSLTNKHAAKKFTETIILFTLTK